MSFDCLHPAQPVFTLLPELLRGSASWRYVIFACLIIAIMSLRPQGVVTGQLMRRLLK